METKSVRDDNTETRTTCPRVRKPLRRSVSVSHSGVISAASLTSSCMMIMTIVHAGTLVDVSNAMRADAVPRNAGSSLAEDAAASGINLRKGC
jgi:hypothetical protein